MFSLNGTDSGLTLPAHGWNKQQKEKRARMIAGSFFCKNNRGRIPRTRAQAQLG